MDLSGFEHSPEPFLNNRHRTAHNINDNSGIFFITQEFSTRYISHSWQSCFKQGPKSPAVECGEPGEPGTLLFALWDATSLVRDGWVGLRSFASRIPNEQPNDSSVDLLPCASTRQETHEAFVYHNRTGASTNLGRYGDDRPAFTSSPPVALYSQRNYEFVYSTTVERAPQGEELSARENKACKN